MHQHQQQTPLMHPSTQLRSLIFTVSITAAAGVTPSSVLSSSTPPRLVGWERNFAGRAAPRLVDLGAQMSPCAWRRPAWISTSS